MAPLPPRDGHDLLAPSLPTRLENGRAADLACLMLLLLLAASLFLVRYNALPMQVWDESRNANNAIEMAQNGHWLVAYFAGSPDHWNTKPPLLIWCIAGFLRAGLPPLLALRLPSAIAATATVLLLYFFCRNALCDRRAGLFAGLILLGAPLFAGTHAGKTGDYDSLVTLFVCAYTLAFWIYLDAQGRRRTFWIAIAGFAVALSFLTKGVGGLLALPGPLLYAVLRRRGGSMARDPRFWLTLLGVALLCGGYYGLRQHLDPGYLQAVWTNNVTGRYLSSPESPHQGHFYYLWVLATRFEPGCILLPFAILPFFQSKERRSITQLCLLTSLILLLVISRSQTKLFWYLTPATPLLALSIGIGLSGGLAWLRSHQKTLPRVFRMWVAYTAVAVVLGSGALFAVYYYQIGVERKLTRFYMGGRYGPFLERIRKRGWTKHLLILDHGILRVQIADGHGPFRHYTPEADFYAREEDLRGMQVAINPQEQKLPVGSWVATCDPQSRAALDARYNIEIVARPNNWCELVRTEGTRPAATRRK